MGSKTYRNGDVSYLTGLTDEFNETIELHVHLKLMSNFCSEMLKIEVLDLIL